MGIWSTLFNSGDTVEKVTDAVINTGDKLFYTDEEKADDRRKMREFFPTLLKSYEPFKIAQRVIAIWFSFLFGISFIIGLILSVFNIVTTYKQLNAGVEKNDIITVSIDPLLNIVSTFDLGMIIAIIVGFYFAGGSIESFRKTK